MNMTGARVIAANRHDVWAALLAPDVLKACISGCEELTGSADDGFDATVVQKVGPVKATFKGSVNVRDIVAFESLTLIGEGKGGPAGFAKGSAAVSLADEADGNTRLTYEVDAKVGGKIAQLGSRIVDSFAKKMADQFFEAFENTLEAPQGSDQPELHTDATEAEDKKKGWVRKILRSS